MMSKSTFLAAALFAAAALPAQAQLIVGNDQSGTATIYNVDVTTGVATPIYSTTASNEKPWGMAYDPATNTLYWNQGATLWSSPLSGSLTPTNLGTMMFGAGTVNFVGLGFHNGKLYGTRNIATEAIYEIDPVTLIATQVYVHPSTYDWGGLDFDAANGVLYGLTDTAPAPNVRGLYAIDYVNMTETFLAPYPAGETDIDGLAVANGKAYYVTDGPNTTQANFYVFDVATGMQLGTLPSPFTGSGTFCAAAWAGNTTPPAATAYCFGDGTGTACPCGNSGAADAGCANSVNASGGKLTGTGSPSIAADTFVLNGTGMPSSSALYFQGTIQIAGGAGVVFGDGLRCVAGTVIRLAPKTNVAGASQYPDAGDPPISVKGMNVAGNVREYQCWYRNADPTFCTPATFNLTNAVQATWLP